MYRSLLAILSIFSGCLHASSVIAQDRIGLVIAQAGYQYAAPLKNPPNDARLIFERLEAAGFAVIRSIDEPRNVIGRKIGAFLELAKRKPQLAIVFFAGHGAQVDGRNYLLPIDAEIATGHELRWNAIGVDQLLSDLQEAGPTTILVFLDACRDDPFMGRVSLPSRGLAPKQLSPPARPNAQGDSLMAPRGLALSYSTQAGNVAADGAGENSPYALALAELLSIPSITYRDLVIELRSKTSARTDGRQVPYWTDGITDANFAIHLRKK